jgi:hypothetical protein
MNPMWRAAFWISGFLVMSLPIGVSAQVLDDYLPHGVPGYDSGLGVTVDSRIRDDYVAPGIRLGNLTVKPSLEESIGYNGNVAGLSQAHGSMAINTSVTVQAATSWSQGGLYGYFNLGQAAYPVQPNQNQTNWVASLGGTHDFGLDQLQLSYSHFNLQQTAADIGSLNFQVPETYTVEDIRTAYKSDWGRISVTPGLQVTRYEFQDATVDGSDTSQKYRDRVFFQGSAAFRYEFAPQRSAVVVLKGYDNDYARQQPGLPTRDSAGGSVVGGLEYTANGVFRYRVAFGYEQRLYAATAYKAQGVPIGSGEVIWTPSELTTITGSVGRAIQDAANETTVGYTYTTAKIVVDHEYKRNILLRAYSDIQYAAYQQGGGSQTIRQAGTSVTWLVNRNMHVEARYDYTKSGVNQRPTSFVGNSYERNVVLVEIGLAL